MTDEAGYDPEVTQELLFHVDNLFHNRINFMLTLEALLFGGLAAGWNTPVRVPLCMIGIIFTLLLARINITLARRLRWLMDVYESIEASGVYRSFKQLDVGWPSRTTPYLTYLIPAAALTLWLTALVYFVVVR